MKRWCSCRKYYKHFLKEFEINSGVSRSTANIVSEAAWTFYKRIKLLDPSFEIHSSISNSFTNIIKYI